MTAALGGTCWEGSTGLAHPGPCAARTGCRPRAEPVSAGLDGAVGTYPSGLQAGELGFTGLVGDGRPCFSVVSLTSSYPREER